MACVLRPVSAFLRRGRTLSGWLRESECTIDEFSSYVNTKMDKSSYPLAADITMETVIYDKFPTSPEGERALMSEIMHVFNHGGGVVAFKNAWDPAIVHECTKAFDSIIKHEKESQMTAGDHFGKPGENTRIWNALEKLAVGYPDVFAEYYSNPWLRIVSTAWLGPAYQVTSQVNIVHPGGKAQLPHRDFHLGFMTNAQAETYPAHVHALSAFATLQGAVAHSVMPVESGPTLYLPHSQKYPHGYLAYRIPAFQEYFDKHKIQLPLEIGDAVFFNPALLHGAGSNFTQGDRKGNLLQVSSAIGRSMESVDRLRMTLAVYPSLKKLPIEKAQNTIAACSEGYPFPTNLDFDPPVDGLAPASQADITRKALNENWDLGELEKALKAHLSRQQTHREAKENFC